MTSQWSRIYQHCQQNSCTCRVSFSFPSPHGHRWPDVIIDIDNDSYIPAPGLSSLLCFTMLQSPAWARGPMTVWRRVWRGSGVPTLVWRRLSASDIRAQSHGERPETRGVRTHVIILVWAVSIWRPLSEHIHSENIVSDSEVVSQQVRVSVREKY